MMLPNLPNSSCLRFEPANAHHASWILREMTPDICQWLDRRPLNNIVSVLEYIYNHRLGHDTRYVIYHPALGAIGMASWQKRADRSACIGYWLSNSVRRRGFANSFW